jgi:hypothetical protein
MMSFAELVVTKKRLKTALVECREEIEHVTLNALEYFKNHGPYTADLALKLSVMVNSAQNMILGDHIPLVLHLFPAEELKKMFELLKTEPKFKRAIEPDLVPDRDILRQMSDTQLAVFAEYFREWHMGLLGLLYEAKPGANLAALKQLRTKEKRKVRNEKQRAGKRTKL